MEIITILAILTAATELVVQALKQAMTNTKSNIVVAVSSAVVVAAASALYVMLGYATLSPAYIAEAVAMAVAVWVCDTVGYDKVLQTFKQYKETAETAEDITEGIKITKTTEQEGTEKDGK